MDIKIYKENEKLQEAYEKIFERIENCIDEYKLSYFELFGILECIRNDISKSNQEEEE